MEGNLRRILRTFPDPSDPDSRKGFRSYMTTMNVLIVGSGGREHALAWKIVQSPQIKNLYCAPGNAGIAEIAECIPIKAEDIHSLKAFAVERQIDLTVVGPEAPLAAGIVDEFQRAGLTIFGPSRAAAQIEASKSFCKQLLKRCQISTPEFEVFEDAGEAGKYVRSRGAPIVIKADGLAAGKGVVVAKTLLEADNAIERMLVNKEFGEASNRIVIEECITGEECSIIGITDGESVLPLAPAQDYKRILDNDQGPNTGGMGSYSPVPALTDEDFNAAAERILKPVIRALRAEGIQYRGALYAGLMLTSQGIQVLEFNCRLGDPETQVILPRLESDLVDLLIASVNGTVSQQRPCWKEQAAVCVVMASGGYPGDFERGKLISGLEEATSLSDVLVFHAGTARVGDNLVTDGGRVLGVTGLGDDYNMAIQRAYEATGKIRFESAHYRADIGKRTLNVAQN